jgi:hypothetical protein
MVLTIQQIAEAFSGHNSTATFPYLSETVTWNMVGDKTLEGKQNVMDTCHQSAEYLATVATKFSKFKVVVSDNCIVIDSVADYVDNQQEVSTISSCDIYAFKNGLISEITSYCIELK